MKYIIQGTNGSLRYWVRIYPDDICQPIKWVGIIENATKFDSKEDAEGFLLVHDLKTKLSINVRKALRNYKPQT